MRLVIPLEMADMKGGMLQSVELLLRFLPTSVDKVVFVPSGSDTFDRMKATGAHVVRSVSRQWTVSSSSPFRTAESFRSFRRELCGLLDSRTVLLTNNIAAELLCGLGMSHSSVPRVFVNRGNNYSGISARALRLSLRGCSMFVATTEYQRDVLISVLRADASRIRIIPNSVDCAELANSAAAVVPSWYEHGRFHIATLGFPSAGKNQELLIRSVAILRERHPSVLGIIAGSPGCDSDRAYLQFLKSLTIRLGLEGQIKFIPFTSDKPALFRGIDLLASTSVREGFGRTIIEAMAARRPVVALRAGGPETIISHERTGLLVSENNPAAFATALDRLMTDQQLRASIVSEAALQCSLRYDAANVARAFTCLFEECLGISK